MIPKVGVFHPGTQHSYQAALAFQEGGQLRWHATPIYYDPSKFPYSVEKLLPTKWAARLRRQMQKRSLPELDVGLVRQGGIYSWGEVLANSADAIELARWQNERAGRSFVKRVIRLVEKEPVDVLWGFDTASLGVFRWAKPRGIFCVLDRTTIDSRLQNRIISEERHRNPQYFSQPWAPKSESQLAAEEEEIALADMIVVGSSYCAATLIQNGCSPAKIKVINYGYDESVFSKAKPKREPTNNRRLNFLYAGRVSPLKGVVYLLEAFAQIPEAQASLTLLGAMMIPPEVFSKYAGRVKHVSAVPRSEVAQYFSSADCFIFPSLFEGGGIVLQEMYGAGLGCVQTPVGEGIIEGVNGAFVRASSTDHILAQVNMLIENPTLTQEWCEQSWNHRKGRDWRAYRGRVRAELPSF